MFCIIRFENNLEPRGSMLTLDTIFQWGKAYVEFWGAFLLPIMK